VLAQRYVGASWSPGLAIVAALAVSVLAGAWNGLLVAYLRIQPIVATLILMVAGRGIAQLITDGQIITFENPTLVYLGNYRPMTDPLFTASKETILREFLPALARINPAFQSSWVQESWSFAAPFAQPIVTTDYRAHIPPFETPLPGLYVANMFQVYPHDRGQNYSIELAQRLVKTLAEA